MNGLVGEEGGKSESSPENAKVWPEKLLRRRKESPLPAFLWLTLLDTTTETKPEEFAGKRLAGGSWRSRREGVKSGMVVRPQETR